MHNGPSPYDLVVSLGKNCQPAYQIRRYTGVQRAQVFDWCMTPDSALTQVIRHGFSGWFDPDQLIPHSDGAYKHRESGVVFLHEFNSFPDFASGYAASAPRIEQLIFRWLDLVTSDKNVLFVRIHAEEPHVPSTAADLVRSLVETSSLGFDLLYLVSPEIFDPTWQVEGVTFRPHRRHGPDQDWRGHNADWDAYFAEMGIPKQPDLALGNAAKAV